MIQIRNENAGASTTFENPVYEMEENDTTNASKASTSRSHSISSADMRPEPSFAVIG